MEPAKSLVTLSETQPIKRRQHLSQKWIKDKGKIKKVGIHSEKEKKTTREYFRRTSCACNMKSCRYKIFRPCPYLGYKYSWPIKWSLWVNLKPEPTVLHVCQEKIQSVEPCWYNNRVLDGKKVKFFFRG